MHRGVTQTRGRTQDEKNWPFHCLMNQDYERVTRKRTADHQGQDKGGNGTWSLQLSSPHLPSPLLSQQTQHVTCKKRMWTLDLHKYATHWFVILASNLTPLGLFPCLSSGAFHPSTTVIRSVRQSLCVKHTQYLICYNSSEKPMRVLLLQPSLFQKTRRHQERTPSKLNCILTYSSPESLQSKANHTVYIILSIFHLYFKVLPSPCFFSHKTHPAS